MQLIPSMKLLEQAMELAKDFQCHLRLHIASYTIVLCSQHTQAIGPRGDQVISFQKSQSRF
jgi:predicted urease superfamily metal-dependent hydrolase